MSEVLEDRRPQGGVITRSMPPVDFHHGEIPPECCDPSLSRGEIEQLILAEYRKPGNFQRLLEWLAWRDHKMVEELDWQSQMVATLQVEAIAEIDAGTVWCYNQAPRMLALDD